MHLQRVYYMHRTAPSTQCTQCKRSHHTFIARICVVSNKFSAKRHTNAHRIITFSIIRLLCCCALSLSFCVSAYVCIIHIFRRMKCSLFSTYHSFRLVLFCFVLFCFSVAFIVISHNVFVSEHVVFCEWNLNKVREIWISVFKHVNEIFLSIRILYSCRRRCVCVCAHYCYFSD